MSLLWAFAGVPQAHQGELQILGVSPKVGIKGAKRSETGESDNVGQARKPKPFKTERFPYVSMQSHASFMHSEGIHPQPTKGILQ